ncbi:bifunctional diguanylate cyclase/phosphodiesterase [Thalassotalea euphylliae]|uniref:Bifunctional diguanylate cyclase/phosphodiesterase n=1 Tax=Thalassotalea euphylliae TaxID=1655234 RepID=A0A3E0TM40_9GAMM|nr:bifunctional diguanylate cyclase/phosphodiesterase [Thalassotalea euphylliae]REL25621.1 bifunctional diguanylate cyclase/phosphodiesterase [Thalassotalea euphylliae]
MTNDLAQFFGIQSSQGRYRHALQSIQEKFNPSHCFIGKFVDNDKVRTVLHLADGKETNNFIYELTGTPCAEAKKSLGTCCYRGDVQTKFPSDAALKEWQIESYIAVTIRSFNDKPVGILVCLFDQAMDITASEQAWFREVGYLIGAEFKYELNTFENQQLVSHLSLGESLAKLCTVEWRLGSDYVLASDYAYQLFGLPKGQQLTRQELLALIDPREHQKVNDQLAAVEDETVNRFDMEVQICTPADELKQLKVLGVTKQDSLTGELIVQLSIQDITEEKRLNRHLMLSNMVLANSSEAVMITDNNNKIIWVNKALETLTGYQEDELIGKDPAIFSSGKQDSAFYQAMWEKLLADGIWRGEIINQRKNGEVFPEELVLNLVRDQYGQISHYVALFRDITEWKETERRLTFYANKEPLTGLANRRAFIEQVEQQVALSNQAELPFVVLFADIDRFKEINDIYGLQTADWLLKQVASRLQQLLDSAELVCRYGADEFAFMLPNHDLSQAQHFAERVQATIAEPFYLDQLVLQISISLGLAEYSANRPLLCDPGEDKVCEQGASSDAIATALLRDASYAMLRAKESAKQEGSSHATIGIHDTQLQQQYLRRLAIRDQLKVALSEQQLTVNYQPIICAQSQKIEKFEALVRWHDANLGFVSPGEFIPIAEEFGLITQLGQFVLERACQDLRALHQLGYTDISFSINRSINEFRTDNDQVQLVTQAINAAEIPADSIVIEITESVAMSSNHYVNEALAKLKESGVKIALDDFCTGFSSLSNLIEYPVDILKIDKSFVDNILTECNQSLLTQTLVSLAEKLDMQVIAEGVETLEQLECLRDYGCNQIQGYFFSPAVAIDSCIELLTQERA